MSRYDGIVLNVQTPGEPFLSAYRRAFFEPFERETGIRIVHQRGAGESAKAQREMIATGNYQWDVAITGRAMNLALRDAGECYLEPLELDASLIGLLPPESCDAYFAGDHIYSNVLAFRTDAFEPEQAPKSWRDFWNLSGFPGRRSLRSFPIDTLEEALLADGVDPSRLYPLDTARGFAALERLRNDVRWWFDADDQVLLLTEDKADICAISNLRAVYARELGAPVGICWNQNIRTLYGWEILRGNPNADIARDFIRFALDARRQAERSKYVAVSPAMPTAAQYLSAERLLDLPDAYRSQAIDYDAIYWSRERPALERVFTSWLGQA